MYCKIGEGCAIYDNRPKACRDFSCLWLSDETIPEYMRPDHAHMYPSGKLGDDCLKIIVDPEFPDAWKYGRGAAVINHFRDKGFHLLIVIDKQINFINGVGKEQPEKLVVDWLL